MNADTFFRHYGLTENPFAAEEARLDPIFDRLMDEAKHGLTHPDYQKIAGRVDQPATAIVFGEKGSGKTAIKMLMNQQIDAHNAGHDEARVLAVQYDDLNPVLDGLMRARGQDPDKVLESVRLEDHQDAILSLATTKLVSGLLGETDRDDAVPARITDATRRLRQLPRQKRVDLAVLAALYDQPRSGTASGRLATLRKKLRLGMHLPPRLIRWAGVVATIVAAVAWVAVMWIDPKADGTGGEPWWLTPAAWVITAGTAAIWGYWLYVQFNLWRQARSLRREMPAVGRSVSELHDLLSQLRPNDLKEQPLPAAGSAQTQRDDRYQLTRRLIDALGGLGFAGMVVMVDRVDEPTAVSGDPQRMRSIVWPMFDNKFLKQDRVGLKLLLPIELRYLLNKESPQFFQEARLDKQNLVDRLTWSGATLYDLCTERLRACQGGEPEPGAVEGRISLTDLFEEGVGRTALIDALEQMHQPRDAFKFLYAAIQEHCQMTADDEATYKIARLTLETVRKAQSQRVQEFYRGLSPA